MPYTVNKTDSTESPNQYTVQDSVLNTQTDIALIGKDMPDMVRSLQKIFYIY